MIYRGFVIKRTTSRGCLNYWAPYFGAQYVAVTLATLRRWIDQAIASRELRDGGE